CDVRRPRADRRAGRRDREGPAALSGPRARAGGARRAQTRRCTGSAVSSPALILSGYLAGIQLHGVATTDALELQSRVAVSAQAFDVHAAHRLGVALAGAP